MWQRTQLSTKATRSPRCSGDAGVAMVESAIIALPFFLLIFGMFEYGLLFRDYLTISNVTTSGARIASASADSLDADFRILTAMDVAAAALPRNNITQIVIYEATGPDDSIANYPACTDADNNGVTDVCNHYTSYDLLLPDTEFGCNAALQADDGDWCPTRREAYLDGPPDWIGVWIEFEYNFITGVFGSQMMLTDEMVLLIEPQGLVSP